MNVQSYEMWEWFLRTAIQWLPVYSTCCLCTTLRPDGLEPSVQRISQARIVQWVASSFWESSQPLNPGLLYWQADSFTAEPPGKASIYIFRIYLVSITTRLWGVNNTWLFQRLCLTGPQYQLATASRHLIIICWINELINVLRGEQPHSLKGQGHL